MNWALGNFWKTAAIHMSSLMTKKGRTPSLRRSSQTPMWQALLANLHCMPPAMIEGWLEQILQDDDKGAGHPCIRFMHGAEMSQQSCVLHRLASRWTRVL